MIDIFKQYKKHKIIQNSIIITCSLFFALGVNFSLGESDFSKYIKSNILESNNIVSEEVADIYLEEKNGKVILKIGTNINNIKNLNLSLIYNPENILVLNTKSNIDIYDINLFLNEGGITNIAIGSESYFNLNKGDELLEIEIVKKSNNIEYINIVNGNFTDSIDEMYRLKVSGTKI